MTVTPFSLGFGARYRCTREPCPVADMYGDILLGLPGRGYTCECGAPMVEQPSEPALTGDDTSRRTA